MSAVVRHESTEDQRITKVVTLRGRPLLPRPPSYQPHKERAGGRRDGPEGYNVIRKENRGAWPSTVTKGR